MKIEIDLINDIDAYKIQLLAVNKYIKENIESIKNFDFFGRKITVKNPFLKSMTLFSIPEIKETNKKFSTKISMQLSKNHIEKEFWIDCKKTPTNIYKFKLRNA